MRILIISTFFPPLNSIASLRPHSWARYWTEAGHEVMILTTQKERDTAIDLQLPNPGYQVLEVPYPRFFSALRRDYHTKERGDAKPAPFHKKVLKKGFHYLRYKRGVFNACRMPDFTELWRHSALKAIETKGTWDLVVSTAGPYTVHMIAEKMKKRGMAKKWIADYRDTWSDSYMYPGIFPFTLLEKWWEKKLLGSADAITTVSKPLVIPFAKKYGKAKVHLIENGFDPSDLKTLPEACVFPEDGKFRIVHTGFIYQGKRDPRPLFKAIQEMNLSPQLKPLLDKLEVVFVGPQEALLLEMIAFYGVEAWVKSQGMVSRETALRMQRDAHALLFLPWNDAEVDGVLTGKIFEYLFSRTPIIAVGGTKVEASQKLILDAQAGDVFFHASEIKHYLEQQLHTVQKQKKNVNSALLNQYDRKALAARLLDIAKDL